MKSEQSFHLYKDFPGAIADKINLREERYGDFEGYSIEDIAGHLTDEFGELTNSEFSAEEAIDLAACCYMIWFKRQKEVASID